MMLGLGQTARATVCRPGQCGIPSTAEQEANCVWWQKYQMALCDCGGSCDCPQCTMRPEIKIGGAILAALAAWKVLS